MFKSGFLSIFSFFLFVKSLEQLIPIYILDTGNDRRDIVFLVDGSDDSRNGLPAIREFIRRMVEDIEDEVIRVAVVQYSDYAKTYFNLNTHKTKSAIVYAVRGLRHKGGTPRNTGLALQYVHDHVFTSSSGSRRSHGVPQILLLLIGGKSSDDVSQSALNLKHSGVLTFALGMKNAQLEELGLIASSSNFLYNFPVFGELLSIQQEIATFIQEEVHPFIPAGKTFDRSKGTIANSLLLIFIQLLISLETC